MQEFYLVTGLSSTGTETISKFRRIRCVLKDKYFIHVKNVYPKNVEQVWKNFPSNTKDKEVVKIGILLLISPYLFTTPYPKQVPENLMSIIDSFDLDKFPWGQELFTMTFSHVKVALSKGPTLEEKLKGLAMYRLYGFPMAFQIWIYESIPSLVGVVCKRVCQSQSRILNWNTDIHVKSSLRENIALGGPDV
ncbi:Ulp1 protease family [Abeliophyllum distichum]|uniref:Ulp1 protease family n=1 Tax=Abeliophyllum distichum TaxID=126358 RepID=A0ABD1SBQ4_9LAMI